ncbi:hypothetical protein [Providencia sp. PROV273]|uniref:hypothetical protein n=1 Tax=Providencia sp. PROV273 TaxID=2949960 RepID=UPI00234A5BE7|nr:hypothetical protein [Providencia sp. PROV273]
MVHIENKLLQDMIETLKDTLECEVTDFKALSDNIGIDYVFEVNTERGIWVVPVEVKKQAYPRDVKHAIWIFNEFCQKYKYEQNVMPIFVAELISEGAREILKAHNIGYYELNGTLFIKNKQILIDIQRPRKRMTKTGGFDLFSDAREMVIHALLQSHGDWFSGEELSSFSDTSAYTVSGVLKELELREWVVKSNEGGRSQRRRLVNPTALLNAWTETIKQRKKNKFYGYIFASDIVDCVINIGHEVNSFDNNINWAITGALAANQASPLLTGVNVAEIIVPQGKAEIFAKSTGIKHAEKGYNVVVHEWTAAGLQFIKVKNGLPVASNFIQYLSLLDGKGRNAELAEQFRREILEM